MPSPSDRREFTPRPRPRQTGTAPTLATVLAALAAVIVIGHGPAPLGRVSATVATPAGLVEVAAAPDGSKRAATRDEDSLHCLGPALAAFVQTF